MPLPATAPQAPAPVGYAVRRSSEEQNESAAGPVPVNPETETARPAAGRPLSRMHGIHLPVTETDGCITGCVAEKSNSLRNQMLLLLNVPTDIYDINSQFKKL